MVSPAVSRPRVRAAVAATVPGWLVLLGGYGLVLPGFGVVSPVTWIAAWLGWLGVIAVPGLLAVRHGMRGARPVAAAMAGLALLGGFLLWLVEPPQLTVEGHFRQHRDELAALAADYRSGSIDSPVSLPLWLRPLSIDGRAHPRCAGERDECALFLPMWRGFRAEQGAGIAYYPVPPGPDAVLATASGDAGAPLRPLGDGWWVIG